MDILPDSRLANRQQTVMIDMAWEEVALDGTSVQRKGRVEFEPIFCISCCKKRCGYVPVGLISSVSWLCEPCAVKHGVEAAASRKSDHLFWERVNEAMTARFGRVLTGAELDLLAHQGRLGPELEMLERESPYATAKR